MDVDEMMEPSVSNFLKQQGTYDDKWNKEQNEYLDALQKQEIAEKELHGMEEQLEKCRSIADIYKTKADQLKNFYEQQDLLLNGIFGGEYGSSLENELEAELDQAMEWQQRVSLAKFKWSNARVLISQASIQMQYGNKRWLDIPNVDTGNTKMKYFTAAEARNNFIAASQNISAGKAYLSKVKFPYCNDVEMEEFDDTLKHVFTDAKDDERYQSSKVVYESLNEKVAALIQWFDKTIQGTITSDFENSNNEVNRLQTALREERLRLMKEKADEEGLNVNWNPEPGTHSV